MRTVVLAVAAGIACSLTAGCTSSEEKAKQNILRVLRADKDLAKKRDSLTPNAAPGQIAWSVGQYCNDLERLDMSDCPPDFQVAYRHHMGAWREAQAAIQALPDGFLEGLFMGAMNRILRGERDGGVHRLEIGLNRALERVRDTWIEVEKIGARYGAAL
jgi:hypothetical protein